MPLEPTGHARTRIIDIDGTVVNKKAPEDYFRVPTVALPGAVELVNRWFKQGDYIVFWTARPEEYIVQTMDMLDRLGFFYHELICGKPYCHEIHIYDDNPVFFHQVVRDEGIGQINYGCTPEKKLFELQAQEIKRLQRLLERFTDEQT